MNALEVFGAILLGLVVRFGLPVAATIALIWLFRRLDEKWRQEAEQSLTEIQARIANQSMPCWEFNQCPESQREKCPSYQQRNKPCWQVYRRKDGTLEPRCLGCEFFRKAPIPLMQKH